MERAVTLGGQIKRTKTEATRTVRLTKPLAGVLDAWHRRALRRRLASEYVFPSRTGALLSAKTMGRRFQVLLRRAGLPRFKLYDLRHTYASQLLHLRVPLTTVARQLGHAKPTTTLQFYAHAIPDDDTSYLDRLTAARQEAQ